MQSSLRVFKHCCESGALPFVLPATCRSSAGHMRARTPLYSTAHPTPTPLELFFPTLCCFHASFFSMFSPLLVLSPPHVHERKHEASRAAVLQNQSFLTAVANAQREDMPSMVLPSFGKASAGLGAGEAVRSVAELAASRTTPRDSAANGTSDRDNSDSGSFHDRPRANEGREKGSVDMLHSSEKGTTSGAPWGGRPPPISLMPMSQRRHFSKTKSTLHQGVRDWRAEGAAERAQSYGPLLPELERVLPVTPVRDTPLLNQSFLLCVCVTPLPPFSHFLPGESQPPACPRSWGWFGEVCV